MSALTHSTTFGLQTAGAYACGCVVLDVTSMAQCSWLMHAGVLWHGGFCACMLQPKGQR